MAVVVNTEIVNPTSSLTINSDFVCHIVQLIPEDAVIFGGKLYEQSSADNFICDSLTKQLSRLVKGSRCVKDHLKPSHIIYACKNCDVMTNEVDLLEFIDSLVSNVNNRWYTKLKGEVERARNVTPTINRGNDGKIDCCMHLLISIHRLYVLT